MYKLPILTYKLLILCINCWFKCINCRWRGSRRFSIRGHGNHRWFPHNSLKSRYKTRYKCGICPWFPRFWIEIQELLGYQDRDTVVRTANTANFYRNGRIFSAVFSWKSGHFNRNSQYVCVSRSPPQSFDRCLACGVLILYVCLLVLCLYVCHDVCHLTIRGLSHEYVYISVSLLFA